MLNLLSGVRVVSLNHFLLGPVGTQHLADLGADVISVEPLDGAFQRNWGGANKRIDDQSMLFLAGNRNKRSLALDMKSKAGREVVERLIAQADVLAENFRPGVMDRLGLGCETLLERHPGLIYAAASGFGADGPYADRPGQDLLIQAMSGLARITGSADGARPVGVSAADHHGAALFALGILAALFRREKTGKGGRVDVNLLSAAIDLQVESFTCFMNGEQPETVYQPKNVGGWYFAAPYGIYATRDGEIAISLGEISLLAKAIDRPELNDFDKNAQYVQREEVAAIVAAAFAQQDTAHWVERLNAEGVWHSVVNDYPDVVRDPQVRHNDTFIEVEGATGSPIRLVNHPIRYDEATASVSLPPQPLSAQAEQILHMLEYSDDEIETLFDSGVVRRPGT
ncbi:CaiB/BaiF CoA transferase family protein [Pelagibacterium halotolerans]|uniref:CaiB/BaiF CoA transferase family protein n=1 Tax=Pelagibacterium halotolerans TaxID=531813 RepID=UPI0008980244|nr:CoA transferase [Pelagibacterium halotolerans]QJR17607.1 CoA transferase [Pelagibacterium halotolerans]SEA84528.1 Crotonobetainyl-CoA:carnitine CoA-transferase CaiB [Pelagibacterium halotolerans]